MVIYGLKNCDTCRKAAKALEGATLHDVRADGLPPQVRDAALAQFGPELINTRSATWRGMSEMERAAPPTEQLAAHPALMKRPLIAVDDRLYLGWTPDTQKALGL